MSTISRRPPFVPQPTENGLPLLCNGDRMKQPEFHRRYESYPEGVRAELIGGVVYMSPPVYMPSPLRWLHGALHNRLGLVLGLYQAGTTGVEAGDNATILLGERNEPQPDLGLRVLPEYGGRSRTTEDDYVEGPPELLAEIAHSSRAIDMNQKRDDYAQAGVLEYLVLCVEERELHWSHFPSRRMVRPDRKGVARSRVFPGLWIDVAALLERDGPRLGGPCTAGLANTGPRGFRGSPWRNPKATPVSGPCKMNSHRPTGGESCPRTARRIMPPTAA